MPRRRRLPARSVALVGLVLSLVSARPAWAAAGDLDPAFGNKGRVITTFPGGAWANAVKFESDGKLVAVGYQGDVATRNFAVARYLSNGSLDTSFTSRGKTTLDFGGADYARDVAIQSDDKPVVVGTTSINDDFALARFNVDGTLDTSFGNGGMVTTDFGRVDIARSVAVESDGTIIVAGLTGSDFAVAAYSSDGSLDTAFGTNGLVITDLGGNDGGRGVAVQADGKIVVAGFSGDDFAAVRYNTDGSLDDSFGAGGIVLTPLGEVARCRALVIQDDGKIVLAGYVHSGKENSDLALVRYNSDGTLDETFGSAGIVITDLGGVDLGRGVALEPDGAIVVGGESDKNFAVARYLTDGSLDPSFGTGGFVITDLRRSEGARGVTVQSDGNVVLAGPSGAGGIYQFALTRYLGA